MQILLNWLLFLTSMTGGAWLLSYVAKQMFFSTKGAPAFRNSCGSVKGDTACSLSSTTPVSCEYWVQESLRGCAEKKSGSMQATNKDQRTMNCIQVLWLVVIGTAEGFVREISLGCAQCHDMSCARCGTPEGRPICKLYPWNCIPNIHKKVARFLLN